jgi:hypothetical protein
LWTSEAYHVQKGHNALDMIVYNNEPTTIGLWLDLRNKGANGNNEKMLMPNHGRQNYIMVPPGHKAFLRMPGGMWTGNLRAYPGCNDFGEGCFGELGTATQLEWNTENEVIWADISLGK